MKISNEPVNHVTCAFNSTTFVSLFYDFSLSDDLKFKKYVIYKFNHDGIFVADEEEKKYFLNQLSFLPENERMTYSEQINELINFNETEQKNNIKLK
jgi:hypothetical protein